MRFHRLQVLRRLPHPGRGFTQGLILAGGAVWESTGLYGAVVAAQVPARRGAVGGLRAAAAGAVRGGHLPGG